MDWRFSGKQVGELLDEFFSDQGGFGSFDDPGSVGASKAVIEEESRKVIFNALDVAIEKHGAERIVLIDHVDCSVYGGSDKFNGDAEAEKKFHIEKLKEAKEILQKHYPELKIVTLYLSWNIIEEVE
jgi:carbonic anhydrase